MRKLRNVLTHYTILFIQGPSDVLEAEVYILWPSFRPNGDPLLYLTGQPLVEGKGRCAFVADVNPYGLEVRYIPIKLHIMDYSKHKLDYFIS